MPSIDVYQYISYKDQPAVQAFLQAHAARHSLYQQIAQRAGLNFANTNLTTYPDDDWFNRHYNVHVELNQLVQPDPTLNITDLTNYAWDSDDDFYQWMQSHTLMHRRIDEYFEIAG